MDAPTSASWWRYPLICILLLTVFAWQGYLTLRLFGSEDGWERLRDDRPVLSGVHPQHLYLGNLGAQALYATGKTIAYDLAFQAGYPKTPIFNGSRLAELFLFVAGGTYQPAAYKVGLACVTMLVPLLLLLACRGSSLSWPATFIGVVMGICLWWGPHGQAALFSGDVDVPLAALAVLAQLGMLLSFDRSPGFWSWLGMLFTAWFGWFLQPLLFPIALPLLLIYYLSAGERHASIVWHLILWATQLAAIALNGFWLIDWFFLWWIRTPLPLGQGMLQHRTLYTLWEAPLWEGPVERGFAALLIVGGAVGALIFNETKQRTTARLLGIGAVTLLSLALLGISWEPIGQMGTAVLILPTLWYCCPLAAHAFVSFVNRLHTWGMVGNFILLAACSSLAASGIYFRDDVRNFVERGLSIPPLTIGLNEEQQRLVSLLIEHTGPEARILWEDKSMARTSSHWQALLPLLTDRSYIGGLDPDIFIEHSTIGLLSHTLAEKALTAWNDAELEEYCRHYNVGWIVCWSPSTIERFSSWEGAAKVTALQDDGDGCLFLVKHAARSFALGEGKATLVHADSRSIILSDVVPKNGTVLLSMHYQKDLRATPSRVQVEKETTGYDPIGLVRLRVASPVARVTILWDER